MWVTTVIAVGKESDAESVVTRRFSPVFASAGWEEKARRFSGIEGGSASSATAMMMIHPLTVGQMAMIIFSLRVFRRWFDDSGYVCVIRGGRGHWIWARGVLRHGERWYR
jgi:hypothetical protein